MIAHYEILQGSHEWHKMRYGKIGGTSAKSIFVDSETLLNQLVSARLEEFEYHDDDFTSGDMLRGWDLEPDAREKISEEYGIELVTCGWLQSVSIPLIGFSPDAISKDETVMAEIKCPGRKNHTKYIRDNIVPLDYVHQCIHAFTVNPKLERLVFASFRPECIVPLFHKEITLDTELNVGTEKNPVMMTVQSRVDQAKERLIKIQEDVDREVEKISF